MSKAKMEAAKELIRDKQYSEARVILKTIDHPTAREWLNKLDRMNSGSVSPDGRKLAALKMGHIEAQMSQLNADIESRKSQRRSATIVFIFCLLLSPLGIGIVLLPLSLFNYFRHKGALNRLENEKVFAIQQLAEARADMY